MLTIKNRVRIILIKKDEILTCHNLGDDYYYYPGGKVEPGETIKETCHREINEELGDDIKFIFKGIAYIGDFINPSINEHSIEYFILGDINKWKELDGKIDPTVNKDGSKDSFKIFKIDHLPKKFLPHIITSKVIESYKNNVWLKGEYVGKYD